MFSGSQTLTPTSLPTYTYAASAKFSLSGTALTIVLTNKATAAVTDPAEMLSALFWYSPTTGLTPGSASLTSGSSWVNPSSVAINTGDGYGYASSDPTGPHGANQGVSAVGIGFFGDGNFAGYSTPRVHLDGDAYDILPANGISSSGKGFNNKYPLANDSMTFTLTLPTGVTSLDISDVSFQYSSAITGPNVVGNVPVPPTALLLGSGLMGMGLLGWRRFRKS